MPDLLSSSFTKFLIVMLTLIGVGTLIFVLGGFVFLTSQGFFDGPQCGEGEMSPSDY